MEEKGKKEVALKIPEKILDLQLPTAEEVKKYLCPNATDGEIWLFLQTAKMMRLNPFKKQIYLLKYGTGENAKASIVTSYEVYLERAQQNLNWGGFKVGIELDSAGKPTKATCEVYRKDWKQPLSWEVTYDEYVQRKVDGTVTKIWREKPITMLKKVAIGQAFKMAFPEETAGLPTMAITEGDMIGSNGYEIKDVSPDKEEPSKPEPELIKPKEKVKIGNGKKDFNLFWMTSTAKGFPKEEIRKIAKKDYGIKESLTELTQEQFDELLERIQKSTEQGKLL